MAKQIGASKTVEYKLQYCRPPANSGIAYRFPKGHVPANKGKRQSEYMSKEQIARTAKTRFKKGHLPHNTLYDGCISIRKTTEEKGGRPYAYLRTELGTWVMYHVWLYETFFGAVPKGKIIVFKDNDSLNLDPDNLMAITRQEHAARTRLGDGFIASRLAANGRGTYDPELKKKILKNKDLIQVKRLQIILNHKIKEHEAKK